MVKGPYSLILTVAMSLAVYSCTLLGHSGSNYGHIKEVQRGTFWHMETPPGMRFIPGGAFHKYTEQSLIQVNEPEESKSSRLCSVDGFHMDKNAVANRQYKQFLEEMLAIANRGKASQGNDLDSDFAPMDVADEEKDVDTTADTDNASINIADSPFANITEAYIKEVLYPDLSELREIFGDAEAAYYIENYFEYGGEGQPYANFPVLGICYEAAEKFCEWRTEKMNEYRKSQGLSPLPPFSLPTPEQREYAARGGHEMAIYPWGGPYVRDRNGDLFANFKTDAHYYGECGYKFASPVGTFPPNGYGLYDMAGNVREYVKCSHKDGKITIETMGGSCLKIAHFMQPSVREQVRSPRYKPCDAGFRCVLPHVGTEPNQ